MVPFHIMIRSLPSFARLRCCPDRNPSPRPTSTSSEPTPHAIPNIVRKLRSLLAAIARKTSLSVSVKFCIVFRRCPVISEVMECDETANQDPRFNPCIKVRSGEHFSSLLFSPASLRFVILSAAQQGRRTCFFSSDFLFAHPCPQDKCLVL